MYDTLNPTQLRRDIAALQDKLITLSAANGHPHPPPPPSGRNHVKQRNPLRGHHGRMLLVADDESRPAKPLARLAIAVVPTVIPTPTATCVRANESFNLIDN